jgi:hypothetical protein
MPLLAQLAHERRLHRESMQEKDRELRELLAQLGERAADAEQETASSQLDEAVEEVSPPAPSGETALEPPPHGIVLADRLWVRTGPGAEHPRIARLTEGTAVNLESRPDAGWVRISSPEEGWVAAEFLDFPGAELGTASMPRDTPIEAASAEPSNASPLTTGGTSDRLSLDGDTGPHTEDPGDQRITNLD